MRPDGSRGGALVAYGFTSHEDPSRALVMAPDGHVWSMNSGGFGIFGPFFVRVTPDERVGGGVERIGPETDSFEVFRPAIGGQLEHVAAGADSQLWFTDSGRDESGSSVPPLIGRLEDVVPPSVISPAPSQGKHAVPGRARGLALLSHRLRLRVHRLALRVRCVATTACKGRVELVVVAAWAGTIAGCSSRGSAAQASRFRRQDSQRSASSSRARRSACCARHVTASTPGSSSPTRPRRRSRDPKLRCC